MKIRDNFVNERNSISFIIHQSVLSPLAWNELIDYLGNIPKSESGFEWNGIGDDFFIKNGYLFLETLFLEKEHLKRIKEIIGDDDFDKKIFILQEV